MGDVAKHIIAVRFTRESTGKYINRPVEVLLLLPLPSWMSICASCHLTGTLYASCHLTGTIKYEYVPIRDVVLMEKDY